MALVFQNGITTNSATGQIVGVGDKTGGNAPSSSGVGSFSSYNPSTNVTTYSAQPTSANPQGLSAAQVAANSQGMQTQATVNQNNY